MNIKPIGSYGLAICLLVVIVLAGCGDSCTCIRDFKVYFRDGRSAAGFDPFSSSGTPALCGSGGSYSQPVKIAAYRLNNYGQAIYQTTYYQSSGPWSRDGTSSQAYRNADCFSIEAIEQNTIGSGYEFLMVTAIGIIVKDPISCPGSGTCAIWSMPPGRTSVRFSKEPGQCVGIIEVRLVPDKLKDGSFVCFPCGC